MSSACVTDDGGDEPPIEEPGGGEPPVTQPPVTQPPPMQTCALVSSVPSTGSLTATISNQCQVPGSMGQLKWYRLVALVPGTTNDVVQIELWDGRGAFANGVVANGTYTITGADAVPATCGVCARALGDKGAGTSQEYFATAGVVEVESVGGTGEPFVATIRDITFEQVDAVSKAVLDGGCASSLAEIKVSGTVVAIGGGGGGGGGGTGGGNNCPLIIGD